MLECAGRGTAPSSRLSYLTFAAVVVVNDNTDSEGTFASSLPVAAATPVPAAPPAAVPISAPLPPPARPPINAPAAAPPPILVTLLLVWPLPLKVCDPVAMACPFTSARRIESKPGACSRPLCLTPVTRHFAGSPTLANFFPCKTTSRATEQGIVLPALALLEDRVAP